MNKETKTVEVPVRRWWQRFGIGASSVEKTIDEWRKEGWTFENQTLINDDSGKPTKYVLTFAKE